ncbi:glycoside hydrolase superfamily [Hyaloraphidium curvatum]|nr:glycoside hydrolase superfamily [Hyaloraphidium curvatum]
MGALKTSSPPPPAAPSATPAPRARPPPCSAQPTSARVAAPNANRLAPPSASAPFSGFCLNWGNDSPSHLAARLGHMPAVICGFLQTYQPDEEWDSDGWEHYVGDIAKAVPPGMPKPILELTLMPNYELGKMNWTTAEYWVKHFAYANYELGIPILLRFAHEMNGNWDYYGMRPTEFIPTWRKFTALVRSYTNMTAMMWAPNVGEGYPFDPTDFNPKPGSPDFLALDTNKDGVLDNKDDPYTPYWPGAEFVDWVGTSLYWSGGAWPDVVNTPPPAGYVEPTIRGDSARNRDSLQPRYDFYAMFAERYGKPMALPESGVSFYYNETHGGKVAKKVSPGAGEMAIKQAWWRQTFNRTLFADLPMLKGVVHFDVEKDDGRGYVDYLITEGEVGKAFKADLEASGALEIDAVWSWGCDGSVEMADAAAPANKRERRSVPNGVPLKRVRRSEL